MRSLIGHRLKDMAELSSVTKYNIVLLSSVVSIIAFSIYSYRHLVNSNYVFGILCALSLIITVANLVYLLKSHQAKHSALILTLVMLAQAFVVFIYGADLENRLLWVYPILAVIIFINSFRIGLIVSLSYCSFVGIAIYGNLITITSDIYAAGRFFITLLAMCGACNIYCYFSSKAINYINSLYLEGIEKLAYQDHLTGLANRWSFEKWATAKLAELNHQPDGKITALVFLDIDNFKHINDTYGHDMGDKILQNFAHRIKNNVRTREKKDDDKDDYSISRFAGDEFVLLLYDVNSLADLDNILHRICHLFDSKYKDNQLVSDLTISVGAALFPQDATTLTELTRCADKAMYAAKNNGKNQYYYYQNAGNKQEIASEPEDKKITPIRKNT